MKPIHLRPIVPIFFLMGAFALVMGALAAEQPGPSLPRVPIMVRVEVTDDPGDVDRLTRLGIDVDGVFDGWARAYVTAEELTKLRGLGFRVTELPDDSPEKARLAREESVKTIPPEAYTASIPAQYHTYATLTSELQQIAADHPNIVRLSSAGQSVQGRELWFVKITDLPDTEEEEPEFSYISSMHGDEVVGKELLIGLINHLTDNYGIDPRVTALVDDTEIWIMPSMNPDGTEIGQRWNAHGVDLNRDFPDQFVDPVNTTAGREAETAAIMQWRQQRSITLASNFHGGEIVANYPFDSNPAGTSTLSPTPSPDDPTFISLARTYADNNPPMFQNNSHPAFHNGVTNGADWYAINGGMQDWNYVWNGGFEVLMELSTIKWPAASTLPGFWNDNLQSMLGYMERVHEGVHGLVTDAVTGAPLAATVQVDANPFVAYSDPDAGDYHRILSPGTYALTVSADYHQSVVIPGVVVTGAAATIVDVPLQPFPVDLRSDTVTVADGANGMLDRGEVTDLAVALRNFGLGATGVSGRLIPTGWDAVVTGDSADYPDIASGAAADPYAPLYEIAANATIDPGRKLGFAIAWDSDQGAGETGPFFLSVDPDVNETDQSTDVPKTIGTGANITVTSTLVVPPSSAIDVISAITVPVQINHTYIGELEIDLISPLGTTVRLHDHTGGSSNDIFGTYGVNLTPAGSLDAFLGEDPVGTWTLRVVDTAAGDGGSIKNWRVELTASAPESSTPEMRLRDFVRDGAGVRLSWWSYPGIGSYRVYRAIDPEAAGSFTDITASDPDDTDTEFLDAGSDPILFYIVTGIGPNGEGPRGHHGL